VLKGKLDAKRLEVGQAKSSTGDSMTIKEEATKPLEPSSGGRTKPFLLGSVLSAVVALAYAFGRVVFNDTLIDAADIEALQVVPVLGIVPRIHRPNDSAKKGTKAGSKKGEKGRVV
jgi:capsular polysaccharide biosynthesis protein